MTITKTKTGYNFNFGNGNKGHEKTLDFLVRILETKNISLTTTKKSKRWL